MKHRWLITILSILAVAGTAALAAYLLLPKSADYERLVGRWLRPDGGYILDIKEIQPDGKVVAVYLNPRPIKVSKAEVKTKAGRINLFVELRDRGYPGSYYTLVYDSKKDRLAGVYHHLGINQNFDVFFVRR